MRRRALEVAAGLALLLGAPSAEAKPLDPANADALVAEARAEGNDGFCAEPERPLSLHARSLCPLAEEVKGCEGLVAACKDDPLAALKRPETGSWDGLGGILGAIANATVWVLIAAVVGLVLWLIASAVARARRDKEAADKPASPAPTVTADAAAVALETRTDAELLLRDAAEHARRGDLDRAVALYLAASLRALDRRGAIRIARHRTNGEYVRSCKEPETKPDLRSIVREVDRVQFGREHATPDRIADVAARASAIVMRAAGASLLVLLVVGSFGACTPKGGTTLRANDPVGDDLLFRVLERDGATVSRLRASLATLPIPKDDEPSPLVIVDAARVPLEEETQAHLARWVEAGGRLLLAGNVRSWPETFKVKTKETTTTAINVLPPSDLDEDDDEGEANDANGERGPDDAGDAGEPNEPKKSPAAEKYKTYPAKVATPAALDWPRAYTIAATDTHEVYAAARGFKRGLVIALAGDDLLTNAGLARAPNAAALVAILQPYAAGRTIAIARPEDAISPPDNPVSALSHAGLGLALAHAAAAVLILILAFGIRQARAKVSPPKARRAWTEHIEATGGLYARARLAPHALAAYARFVDGRLRERMPRGMSDPSAFLALRANADPAWTADVWRRATAARAADRPEGDELATLRHLSALYAAAVKSE